MSLSVVMRDSLSLITFIPKIPEGPTSQNQSIGYNNEVHGHLMAIRRDIFRFCPLTSMSSKCLASRSLSFVWRS